MLHDWITQLLETWLPKDFIDSFYVPTMIFVITILSLASYWFCKRILITVVRAMTRHTETEWDDDLLNDSVLRAVSQLAPALLVAYLLPRTFDSNSLVQHWLVKITDLYILMALVHLINAFLQALFDALDKRGKYRIHTMKGVLQMLKLFFIIIAVIISISILIGKSPIVILTALGASAAVLMLIFQDSILGLVAGIQLTVNDMLKKGDWIVVPKANANGVVTEVTLTTVKVQNWDNSVTTIPPYTLIKESFQNYDPMIISGARRVCRNIFVDVNSIRFLTDEEIARLIDLNLINADDVSTTSPSVNLHLLIVHLERYIKEHPDVRNDQLFMVRQLQPTTQGIPLELYFFTDKTSWKEYEHVQSKIFNYVYASIQSFGLQIYQAPAGNDFKQLPPNSVIITNN